MKLPPTIWESSASRRDVLQARGVRADHHGTFLLDQPLGGLDPDARRVVLADLLVIAAVLAPVLQRAGADQDDRARRDVDALPLESAFEILDRDLVVRRQGVDVLVAGDVEQDSAGDDRRDGRHIALADAEVAAPVLFLEAVVPVIVLAVGDVAQAIDLRGDVVVHEQGAAVPARRARCCPSRAVVNGKSFCRATPSGVRKLMISPGLWPGHLNECGRRARRDRRSCPA